MNGMLVPQPPLYRDAPAGSSQQKYMQDPEFHLLVDSMTSLIRESRFSPSELREAAVFAAIRYEQTQVRSFFVYEGSLG